jgi:hypothetical protein
LRQSFARRHKPERPFERAEKIYGQKNQDRRYKKASGHCFRGDGRDPAKEGQDE